MQNKRLSSDGIFFKVLDVLTMFPEIFSNKVDHIKCMTENKSVARYMFYDTDYFCDPVGIWAYVFFITPTNTTGKLSELLDFLTQGMSSFPECTSPRYGLLKSR